MGRLVDVLEATAVAAPASNTVAALPVQWNANATDEVSRELCEISRAINQVVVALGGHRASRGGPSWGIGSPCQ